MEAFMRLHFPLFVFVLGLCMLATLPGCSSKPTGANGSAANGPTDNGSSASNTSSTTPAPAPEAKADVKPAPLPPAVVPAGTSVTVRLGQTVGSKVSQPGQTFSATVAHPVEVAGQTVIPAGATAAGTVVDAKPLGHFAGGARLQLTLTSINLNGMDQPVQTSSVVRVLKGKGKRTGIMAGGGAGLGALIGGLAGGGKGAAIGALAGGGAGTAGGALTGNKEIVLPAESAVTFKLSQPLEVK
jgi:hypothetical protein